MAKVFHIGLTGEDEVVLHPHLPTKHLHHKANSTGIGHIGFDKEFFAQGMNAVSDAGEILIIGPASAKTEFAKYLREQHGKIGDRIVAVEAADHPSDREIVAYARQHSETTEAAAEPPANDPRPFPWKLAVAVVLVLALGAAGGGCGAGRRLR